MGAAVYCKKIEEILKNCGIKTKEDDKHNFYERQNRIYTLHHESLDKEIITCIFSVRDQKSGKTCSLIASTDEDNISQMHKAGNIAKNNHLKFFLFGVYDDTKGNNYPIMNDYILSIESFDFIEQLNQKAMKLDKYVKILEDNNNKILRVWFNDTVSLAFVKKSAFFEYIQMFDNRPYMKKGAIKGNKIEYVYTDWQKNDKIKNIEYPRNLLIHGAPGTGKSTFIDEYFKDNKITNYCRVTFYEDYTYGQFVGAYKPVPIEYDKYISIETSINESTSKSEGYITNNSVTYKFVPGPFANILIDAYEEMLLYSNDDEHEMKNFYLVIEEINRAKAARVFGDIFQLLDRKNGVSKYDIKPSIEFINWFNDELEKRGVDLERRIETIVLPPNLYIWATMNSADQSVAPLDSAFKRRWEQMYKDVYTQSRYKYICLNYKQEKGIHLSWDEFRNGINNVICSIFDEDRCIGPGFFSEEEMNKIDEIYRIINDPNSTEEQIFKLTNPLVDKLFAYLRVDVFRNNPTMIFNDEYKTMHDIRYAICTGVPVDMILNIDDNNYVEVKEN